MKLNIILISIKSADPVHPLLQLKYTPYYWNAPPTPADIDLLLLKMVYTLQMKHALSSSKYPPPKISVLPLI